MQSFYAPSQALQQTLFREEAAKSCEVYVEVEAPLAEKRVSSVAAQRPAPTAGGQSSLYARNASWNTPKFGSRQGVGSEYGGGARAVALEAAIRRPHSSEELRELVKIRLSEFDPGHMVGALSRFANLNAPDIASSPEITSLLRSTCQNLDVLVSQDVSGLAWSLAKLLHNSDGILQQALCARIVAASGTFTPHHIANVSWAAAKLEFCDSTIWAVLAERATSQLHLATGGELSMTLWAFATSGAAHGVSYPDLFGASSTLVRSKLLSELSPTSLANISWAFAKHGVSADSASIASEDLFADLCAQASKSVHQFSGWELCTLSWAFVTVQMIDEHVLSQIATRACASSLTLQNASSMAWAFAAAGIADEPLFGSISKRIHRQVDELDSGVAARFVWAYGSLELVDIALLDPLATFAEKHMNKFTTRDLSSLAIGLVRASYKGSSIFIAIASEAIERMQTLGPLELTNIFWAISSQVQSLGQNQVICNLFDLAEKALLNRTQRQIEPEALSTAVVAFRRIGRLDAALELHKALVADDPIEQNCDTTSTRRERYRLQFRSQDEGYPKQISYGALLMEAERRGDTELVVNLLEGLAEESRSACARSCFLNVAVWTYARIGHNAFAEQLLLRMVRAGLFNIVSERLAQKLGLSQAHLQQASKACMDAQPKWADRRSAAGDMEKAHSKEFSVLQGVLSLKSIEPSTVLAEIEDFGLKRAWIKVAGGEKAAVIETVVAACRPRCVLEYGVYVGYNSMRMALQMRSWGGRVVSMEMDPVHACITRNIALLVGLEDIMTVQLGHSDDAVPLIVEKGAKYDMVFMDQRSTRFHTDLMTLVSLQLLTPGCVVVADNVLKPGAPRWLWHITKGQGYSSDIVSVREFGSAETEDWMTVTFLPTSTFTECIVPSEPIGMAQITAKADRMRFRTVARNLDDTRRQLEDVNKDFRREFATWGILRTKMVKTQYDGNSATSEVVAVQDEDVKDWDGIDPRLNMIGGRWCTDVSKCLQAFPHARST